MSKEIGLFGDSVNLIDEEIHKLNNLISNNIKEIKRLEDSLKDPTEMKKNITEGGEIEDKIKRINESIEKYRKELEEKNNDRKKILTKQNNINGKTLYHWFFGPVKVLSTDKYLEVEIMDFDGMQIENGGDKLALVAIGKNRKFRSDSINVWLHEKSNDIYKSPSELIDKLKHRHYF